MRDSKNLKGSIVVLFFIHLILLSIITVAQDSNTVDAMGKANKKFIETNGLRAGWNMASLNSGGSKPDTVNNLNRFYVGYFTETASSKLFSFGTGVEYMQNGTKYANVSRVFHTLSVPIYAKLKLGPVYALGGLGINISIIENLVTDGDVVRVKQPFKSNWFDTPVFAGAGVKLWILNLEMRYHWGLLPVRDELRHQYLQAGLGISF